MSVVRLCICPWISVSSRTIFGQLLCPCHIYDVLYSPMRFPEGPTVIKIISVGFIKQHVHPCLFICIFWKKRDNLATAWPLLRRVTERASHKPRCGLHAMDQQLQQGACPQSQGTRLLPKACKYEQDLNSSGRIRCSYRWPEHRCHWHSWRPLISPVATSHGYLQPVIHERSIFFMLLTPRALFSHFDGVMVTDLALQDERQADGTLFHSIVTLFHPPFLEARGRLFHTT